MDQESFDRLARALGAIGSRRAALGALLGTGLAGAVAGTESAKKDRRKNRRSGKKGRGKAQVSAQAAPDCTSPGVGSNISGCNYQNENHSGENYSSSRMVATNFRNAELVGTNLSSSNAKDAVFREANLCGANLTSSNLRNANFRDANLAFARLSSSACAGAVFTAGTFWCETRDCNGTLRNDDCPGGAPGDLCCTPCGPNEDCIANECECQDNPGTSVSCGDGCLALSTAEGGPCFCGALPTFCTGLQACTTSADCTQEGAACITSTACGPGVCVPACGDAPLVAERRSAGAEVGERTKR